MTVARGLLGSVVLSFACGGTPESPPAVSPPAPIDVGQCCAAEVVDRFGEKVVRFGPVKQSGRGAGLREADYPQVTKALGRVRDCWHRAGVEISEVDALWKSRSDEAPQPSKPMAREGAKDGKMWKREEIRVLPEQVEDTVKLVAIDEQIATRVAACSFEVPGLGAIPFT